MVTLLKLKSTMNLCVSDEIQEQPRNMTASPSIRASQAQLQNQGSSGNKIALQGQRVVADDIVNGNHFLWDGTVPR